MEKILIATTPRTGSNLLMFSLGFHSTAVCGGEWWNANALYCYPVHWENKTFKTDEVNLAKVFYGEELLKGFSILHLFREDANAQIASWKRACETGVWIADGTPYPRVECPGNCKQIIETANEAFRPLAKLSLSYEDLVDDWGYSLWRIQRTFEWSCEPIAMATKRINHNQGSEFRVH